MAPSGRETTPKAPSPSATGQSFRRIGGNGNNNALNRVNYADDEVVIFKLSLAIPRKTALKASSKTGTQAEP